MERMFIIYGAIALAVFCICLYMTAKEANILTLAAFTGCFFFSTAWPLSIPFFAICYVAVCGDDIVLWRRKKTTAPPRAL